MKTALSILAAVVIALGVQNVLLIPQSSEKAAIKAKESTLERVMKTKKLRCAYWLWPELIERNPNTGAMSGAFVDVINKVGEALGAEVVWQQEATFDDFITLANSDKVDAVCGPLIPGPFLRPLAHFASPILYADFDVYVRPNETRFTSGQEQINQPNVNLLTLDGTGGRYFAVNMFPNATQKTLPAVLGAAQVLLDVKDGKADATVAEQLTATRFLDNNPRSLVPLRWNGKPLITLGHTPFVTKVDDAVWANALDNIIGDLLDFGVISKILTSHHLIAGQHYHPIDPPFTPKP